MRAKLGDDNDATNVTGGGDAGDGSGGLPLWAKIVLGLLAAFALLVGGILMLIQSAMKGEVYDLAMAKASSDAHVVAALGSPLSSGFWVSGSMNTSDQSGSAELSVPVSGPKGTGVLYAVGVKGGGNWGVSRVAVRVDRDGKVIQIPVGGHH